MIKIIIQKFRNNATAFGLISIIGGFITDVLQPIAPFSSYIFYASSVATLIIFFAFLFKSTLREKLSNSLTLALSVMIITGIISLVQKFSDNDKKGILASNIPGISKLHDFKPPGVNVQTVQPDLSKNLDAKVALARMATSQGMLQEAEMLFQDVLGQDPSFLGALEVYGVFLGRYLKEYELAEKLLRLAATIMPSKRLQVWPCVRFYLA